MAMSGLASLTATYTDSEGDDDDEAPAAVGGGSSHSGSVPSSATGTPHEEGSRMTRLVSYGGEAGEEEEEEEEGGVENMELDSEVEGDDDREDKKSSVPLDVTLPPEPQGRCSNDLQEKIRRLYNKKVSEGAAMNQLIQNRKDFRNPSIYEKLVTYCKIDELGTNFHPSIYDPHMWGKSSHYDELAKVQKEEMDKREKERKTKVEVIIGTKKPTEEELKKRRSKWDQVGASQSSSVPVIRPAALVQPSLTTSASGTKATVISAFGAISKKSK